MAGLPKKYAKMGFSKGWKAFKASKRSTSRSVTRRSSTRGTKMARRKVRRKATRKSSGARRRSTKSWLPLSGQEMMLDFGIGMAVGPISDWLAPYQQQYLGMFGQYSDEAALAIVGGAAHYFGSGFIKQGGKELFRVAVFSAGQQTGRNVLGGMSNGNGGGTALTVI